jgi:hypothetical protein
VSSHIFLHGNSFSRAYVKTEATALTGDSVDVEVVYCCEPALFLAQSTLCAFALVDMGNVPAPELMLLPDSWLKQKVQVGGVHITVNQYFTLCQSCERANDAGLSGASFTA